ncbi:MAG TPA: hypothetical protein VMU33_14750 [Burkholderiaceae bacterium]|nr:hypothetical protein [Burkholderiaceae bacterium]
MDAIDAPAAAPAGTPTRRQAPVASALTTSAWRRLAIAAVPVALLWLAVAWALR